MYRVFVKHGKSSDSFVKLLKCILNKFHSDHSQALHRLQLVAPHRLQDVRTWPTAFPDCRS